MLNGPLIAAQANRLQKKINETVGDTVKTSLTFTAEWLDNLKRRWNLKAFRNHGKGSKGNKLAVEESSQKLIEMASEREARNVVNADVCGLFYKLAPDLTIAQQRPIARREAKERITVLVRASADGTENIEIMFIGTAMRPQTFFNKDGSHYGLGYHANKHALMITTLRYGW